MSIESMAIVLHHSRANGTTKLVALGIANHDGDGGAWPTVATLARYANVSPRSVQKAIGDLVALGEIAVRRQAGGQADYDDGRRPNLYEIRIACPSDCDRSKHHRTRRTATSTPLPLALVRGEADDTPGVSPTSRGEADDTPRGEADDTPTGEAHVTQTIHLNQPENSCGSESALTTDRASAPDRAESIAAARAALAAAHDRVKKKTAEKRRA